MFRNKFMLPALAAVLFLACAAPVRKAPAAPAAAPVKKEAPVKLSDEDAKKVDRLYYKAVGAYSNNDMGLALKFLDEISALSPSYPPALELREKIRRITGNQ